MNASRGSDVSVGLSGLELFYFTRCWKRKEEGENSAPPPSHLRHTGQHGWTAAVISPRQCVEGSHNFKAHGQLLIISNVFVRVRPRASGSCINPRAPNPALSDTEVRRQGRVHVCLHLQEYSAQESRATVVSARTCSRGLQTTTTTTTNFKRTCVFVSLAEKV